MLAAKPRPTTWYSRRVSSFPVAAGLASHNTYGLTSTPPDRSSLHYFSLSRQLLPLPPPTNPPTHPHIIPHLPFHPPMHIHMYTHTHTPHPPFSRKTAFQCATRSLTPSLCCASWLIIRILMVWLAALALASAAACECGELAGSAPAGWGRGGKGGRWWWRPGRWVSRWVGRGGMGVGVGCVCVVVVGLGAGWGWGWVCLPSIVCWPLR